MLLQQHALKKQPKKYPNAKTQLVRVVCTLFFEGQGSIREIPGSCSEQKAGGVGPVHLHARGGMVMRLSDSE